LGDGKDEEESKASPESILARVQAIVDSQNAKNWSAKRAEVLALLKEQETTTLKLARA